MLQAMRLNGRFTLTDARFNDGTVTKVITKLSRRAQGKPNDPNVEDLPAEFSGAFRLQEANLNISKLQFAVPGVNAANMDSPVNSSTLWATCALQSPSRKP